MDTVTTDTPAVRKLAEGIVELLAESLVEILNNGVTEDGKKPSPSWQKIEAREIERRILDGKLDNGLEIILEAGHHRKRVLRGDA